MSALNQSLVCILDAGRKPLLRGGGGV